MKCLKSVFYQLLGEVSLAKQFRMKLYYLQCKQFQFMVLLTLNEQYFWALSKYVLSNDVSAP